MHNTSCRNSFRSYCPNGYFPPRKQEETNHSPVRQAILIAPIAKGEVRHSEVIKVVESKSPIKPRHRPLKTAFVFNESRSLTNLTLSGRETLVSIEGKNEIKAVLSGCVLSLVGDSTLLYMSNIFTTSTLHTIGCRYEVDNGTIFGASLSSQVAVTSVNDVFVITGRVRIKSPNLVSLTLIRPTFIGGGEIEDLAELDIIQPVYDNIDSEITVSSISNLLEAIKRRNVVTLLLNESSQLKVEDALTFSNLSLVVKGPTPIPVANGKSGLDDLARDVHSYYLTFDNYSGPASFVGESLDYISTEDITDQFSVLRLDVSFSPSLTLTCKDIQLNDIVLRDGSLTFHDTKIELLRVSVVNFSLATKGCSLVIDESGWSDSSLTTKSSLVTLRSVLASKSTLRLNKCHAKVKDSKLSYSQLTLSCCEGKVQSLTCVKTVTELKMCRDLSLSHLLLRDSDRDGIRVCKSSVVTMKECRGFNNSDYGLFVTPESLVLCKSNTVVIIGEKGQCNDDLRLVAY